MAHWCAIANPEAGLPGETQRVARQLRDAGLVDSLVLSTSRTWLEAALRLHAQEDIVIVGGDGTVLAALQCMDRRRQRLAVLPCGHGNCLARDLGAGRLEAAIAALQAGRSRWIDLLQVDALQARGARTRLLAASTVALGYVTEVVRFGRTRLPRLGRRAYAAASLLTVPPRLLLQVHADGECVAAGRATGLVINNTTHLANFRAFPQARLDDGRLDLLLLDAGWTRQLVHNLAVACGSAAFGGRVMQQAVSVEVTSAAPLLVMVDGELLQDVVQLTVTCVPHAVQCVSAASSETR